MRHDLGPQAVVGFREGPGGSAVGDDGKGTKVNERLRKPAEEPKVVRIRLLDGFWVSVGSRTIKEGQWRFRKAASLVKLLALASLHPLRQAVIMEPTHDEEEHLGLMRLYTLYGARPSFQEEQRYISGIYPWHTENISIGRCALLPLPIAFLL